MPDEFDYDPETLTLRLGGGTICPVPHNVWEYEVAGFRVVRNG
jgi:hypothetical protein